MKKGDFEVRNKILILLDTWNEAFSARKYPHYNWAFRELIVKFKLLLNNFLVSRFLKLTKALFFF